MRVPGKGRGLIRELVLMLCVVLAVRFGYPLLFPSFMQTGFIVSGDFEMNFFEDDKVTLITGIDWGDVEVNLMNMRYIWMQTSKTGVRINYFSNNPSWILYEWFYESSPGRWSRWNNNTLKYLNVDWTHLMVRLTAQEGAPEGAFGFNSYFDGI